MKVLTCLAFVTIAFLLTVNFTLGAGIADCDAYYKDHGAAWKNIYDNCTDDQSQQSPVNIDVSDNVWKDFVFLAAYAKTTPTSMGLEDCVFRVRADNIGVVTTNDVYALPKLYKFSAKYIDFHAPSEHAVKGKKFDLEMQIYHKDVFGKSKSKNSMVVSVFFNKGPQSDEFFEFLDGKSPLDVSKVLPIDFMMHNNVYGYLGTKTSEGCANGVGWYISPEVKSISEADFATITKGFTANGNYREIFDIRDKRLFSHPPFFS